MSSDRSTFDKFWLNYGQFIPPCDKMTFDEREQMRKTIKLFIEEYDEFQYGKPTPGKRITS